MRADWRPNIGVSDIETILMLSVGISENVTAVPEDQTRNPIAANIRHALVLHSGSGRDRQPQDLVPPSERTIPAAGDQGRAALLLGAIDEDLLRRKIQLDLERKDLRKLQKLAADREQLASLSAARTEDIFREA
ncbi:hypothetical protein [uncultured Sphingomonas sp.]|uniref:hypothetical protein n=1 Tax=uncultured Sphingomonas sp. TaxID=158754 RepID=UPI0025EEC730|nr:hypothetical protein [uncultured Sphingomonas sp.]